MRNAAVTKKPFKLICAAALIGALWIGTPTFGGAAAFAQTGNGAGSVTVDGRAIRLAHPVHEENQEAYISLDDIFGYYGFKKQTDFKTGELAYISPGKFFTVQNGTGEVKIHGTPSPIVLKSIGETLFINAKDLSQIIPVAFAYDRAAGGLRLTTLWDSEAIVHVDDIRAFAMKGSVKITNSQVWLGIYALSALLPESDVFINAGNLEINSPLDGSYTKIYYDGRLEYRPAGAAQPAVYAYDKAAMLSGAGDKLRLNADLISSYSSYTVAARYLGAAKPIFDIQIQSAWSAARQAGANAAAPGKLVLQQESVPLGAVSGSYDPQTPVAHPAVRDSGYILNTILMDEVAEEINRLRANAGLSPLTVNHSLVYKKQNDTPGRTTAFDNLRWCREHLSGRMLEHLVPAPYMGEVLTGDFNTGLSAAMIVNLWNASPVHQAIMMNPAQREFGICAVQYPNEDIDVAGTFLAWH
jgi:uncharacterized protein YkwD